MIMLETVRPTAPDYSKYTDLELVKNNIETERLQTISLDRVLTEASIIDISHVKDLADSMAGKRGQLSSIVVRAREEDGQIVYDIIDGFHRSAGKKMMGEKEIDAKVVYGCSDEELFDLRILAASSVKSVQFPRVAEWITKLYATTGWAEKGLSVAQAFNLALNDSERSRVANLTTIEVKEIKAWAKAKSEIWGRSLSNVHQILRIVEDADPELVKQVRYQGGGKDRKRAITPQRLQAVVNTFPGRSNFPVQRVLLDYVAENRLSEKETETLVTLVSPLMRECPNPDEFADALVRIDPDDVVRFTREKLSKAAAKPKTIQEIEQSGDDEIEIFPDADDQEDFSEPQEPSDEDLKVIEAEESNRNIAGRPVEEKIFSREHISGERVNHEGEEASSAYDETPSVAELRREIDSLKYALDLANKMLEKSQLNSGKKRDKTDAWWLTDPHLTSKERQVMTALFSESDDRNVFDIADALHILPQQVLALIGSAKAKHFLHRTIRRPKDL